MEQSKNNNDLLSGIISTISNLLKSPQNKAEDFYNQGNYLVQTDQLEEAVASFNQAINIDSTLAPAWSNKANVLDRLERYQEAVDSCDKAIRLDPNMEEAWLNKGRSLIQMKKFNDAMACLKECLKLVPDNNGASFSLAECLNQLGQYDESLKFLQNALKDPQLTQLAYAWKLEGEILEKLDRKKEALESYDKALEINPDYDDALLAKGICLYRLGDLEVAGLMFDKCYAFGDKGEVVWFWRGRCALDRDSPQDADLCFSQSLKINPKYQIAWWYKALNEEKCGRPKDAVNSAKHFQSLSSDPQSEEAKNAKRKLKELEKALKATIDGSKMNENISRDRKSSGSQVASKRKKKKMQIKLEFNGEGDQVVEKFNLYEGLATFSFQNSEGTFEVNLLDADGEKVESLIYKFGSENYKGEKATHVPTDGKYLMNVQSRGKWNIKIDQ